MADPSNSLDPELTEEEEEQQLLLSDFLADDEEETLPPPSPGETRFPDAISLADFEEERAYTEPEDAPTPLSEIEIPGITRDTEKYFDIEVTPEQRFERAETLAEEGVELEPSAFKLQEDIDFEFVDPISEATFKQLDLGAEPTMDVAFGRLSDEEYKSLDEMGIGPVTELTESERDEYRQHRIEMMDESLPQRKRRKAREKAAAVVDEGVNRWVWRRGGYDEEEPDAFLELIQDPLMPDSVKEHLSLFLDEEQEAAALSSVPKPLDPQLDAYESFVEYREALKKHKMETDMPMEDFRIAIANQVREGEGLGFLSGQLAGRPPEEV